MTITAAVVWKAMRSIVQLVINWNWFALSKHLKTSRRNNEKSACWEHHSLFVSLSLSVFGSLPLASCLIYPALRLFLFCHSIGRTDRIWIVVLIRDDMHVSFKRNTTVEMKDRNTEQLNWENQEREKMKRKTTEKKSVCSVSFIASQMPVFLYFCCCCFPLWELLLTFGSMCVAFAIVSMAYSAHNSCIA